MIYNNTLIGDCQDEAIHLVTFLFYLRLRRSGSDHLENESPLFVRAHSCVWKSPSASSLNFHRPLAKETSLRRRPVKLSQSLSNQTTAAA